jgi:hypothetical protein
MDVPFIEPMSISATADTACFGEVAFYALNVEAGIPPFIWLGMDAAQGYLSAGSYEVTAIDARGCVAQSTIEVVEHSQPNFDLNADTACFGQVAAASYTWTNAQLPIELLEVEFDWSELLPGEYELEWMDAAGCIIETAFMVHEYDELVWEAELTDASSGNAQIELEIEGGIPPYDVQWSNGANGNILPLVAAGSYSATITDAAGCGAVAENIFVPLGAGEETEVGAIVFDALYGVKNQSSRAHHIRIHDSAGRIVSAFTLAPGEIHATSELAKGMYFISFEGGYLRFAR